jgi:uncharacterized cupredoxin-like copper-binding protein
VSPSRALPRRRAPRALALTFVALTVAACAGAGPAATPTITPGTSASPRTVNLIAKEWTFLPPVVDLVPGETVRLQVVNGGTEVHEAVFGGGSVQAAWEAAERTAAGAPPGPTPAISVPPAVSGLRIVVRSGERADVLWTVPPSPPSPPDAFVVGCHIPGHYEQGMVVPVRWVGPDGRPLPTPAPPDAPASSRPPPDASP